MLFRPCFSAATMVVAVPQNGTGMMDCGSSVRTLGVAIAARLAAVFGELQTERVLPFTKPTRSATGAKGMLDSIINHATIPG